MAMSSSGSKGVQSEINITPLVDVVLVLLIIFMVATPILQMGLDVEVPPKVEVKGPPPADSLPQLVVAIKRDGYYLNKDLVAPYGAADLTGLQNKLAPHMTSRQEKDRVVFINSDDQIPFEMAVRAMDTIRSSGAQKIGFLTDPPK